MFPHLKLVKFIRDTNRFVPSPLRAILASTRDSVLSDKLRFVLTSLGMLMGTASLILVATFSLAGKHYVLHEIQSIGSNLIYVDHPAAAGSPNFGYDNLTREDVEAVRREVKGVAYASPGLLPIVERVAIGSGKVRSLQVMGVYPEYRHIRNLEVVSGRFFDATDSSEHSKAAVMNAKLAAQLYGSAEEATGKTMKLGGLPFTIVGTFKERVDTFGQTEVSDVTLLVPDTAVQYLQRQPMVKQIFFSAADAASVKPLTAEIRDVIQSRHRPGAVYKVRNLTQLLAVAENVSNALTWVLLAVAFVVLLVSGISIMNIMFDTVRERIREIGIRRAVGATRRNIAIEFLSEAILIALVGGSIGLFVGFAIPFCIRLFTTYYCPVSVSAAILSITVCSALGIVFGTFPALRAAQLDPAESLRQE